MEDIRDFFDGDSGRLVQMIGASGVGKTTLCRAYVKAYPGVLFYDTNYAVFRATILENVLVGRTVSQPALEIAINEILPDLSNRLSSMCNELELSSGQTQRVNFVRNLLGKCGRHMILDEPLSNIDEDLFERTIAATSKICEVTDLKVLIITHTISRSVPVIRVS